ncbi:type II secretion system protein F [Escherichia coli]|nr:type II secretion system protein F [Escherichia coli]EEY9128821.1 type II secretion system protein F [Escherichia coli]
MPNFELAFAKMLFTSQLRMRIYEKLARYLANGVPLTFALDELYKFTTDSGKRNKTPQAIAIHMWSISIRNGDSLTKALKGWVPEDELSILAAGEISGNLSDSISNIIYIYVTKKKVRAALFGIIYPIVLLLSTCLFLYIFGTKVVPAFEQVLPFTEWQGAGRLMYYLAVFVQFYLMYLIAFLIMLTVIIIFTLPYWTGKIRSKFDLIPPWSIYRSVIGCGFLLSLSSLITAGIPTPEAIRIISRNASPWYRERLTVIRLILLNGAPNIGEALYISGFSFPSKNMVMDIRSYAALDGFEMMLERLSRQWQEESVEFISNQMNILKNAAILIMGGVFMWIVSGMFSLQQQISNAAQFN